MNRLNFLFISALLPMCVTASAKDKFTINGCIPGIADSVCVQLRDIEGEKPRIILLSPQGQIICSTYETEIIDEHLKSIFQ